MRRLRLALLIALASMPAFAQPNLQTGIPITVNAPLSVAGVHAWPVTAGIPFPPGLIGGFEDYTIVDDATGPVPCQIDKVAYWPDGTVRWARADFIANPTHAYRLRAGARAPFPAVTVKSTGSGLLVTTGPSRYFFPTGAASFDTVAFDVNGDHVFQSNETIISGARDAFYVLDSEGRRAVLHSGTVTVESAGPLHAVVRAEGTYLVAGARRAAAIIYFHFYAGLPQARVSHKLIVTEDTESLWLFQAGLTIPLTTSGQTRASFSNSHEDPLAVTSTSVGVGDEAVMSQLEFPHHDHDASTFAIERRRGTADSVLLQSAAGGDWADLSDDRMGLTAQVPAFAEQAPKAVRITSTGLTIELWSDYGGQELDFRRSTVYPANFATWFNAFALDPVWAAKHAQQIADGRSTLPSNGIGTAKVHDVWLYPHVGAVQPATLGATGQEIVARADPAWIAASGAFGTIHEVDTARFGATEAAIDDYYTRSIFVSQRVFPQTGYLFHGQYPYVAQQWDFRPPLDDNGRPTGPPRWYPVWDRLAHQMDYNLRRSVWMLWARGGDRKYFDYAKRNTRYFGDFIFSNADVPYKPLGWSAEGLWHSAIQWGQYGRNTHPSYSSNSGVSLAVASSEDVIQFVYDYFLTGDLHSRDVARNWKQAMLNAMQPGVDMNEAVLRTVDYNVNGPHPNAFEYPYLFLRLVGSIYELDHDPLVYNFGHAVLDRLADVGATDNILNPAYETNFSKQLEAISSYYYYWISTGDPVARDVLLRYADFAYRFGRIDGFFNRHNGAVPMAFAVAYRERHDAAVAAYLAQAVREFGRDTVTLAMEGLSEASFSAQNSLSWKPQILDEQPVVGIGLPLAMAATVDATARGIALPEVPYVDKPVAAQPTYLVFEKGASSARIDLFVNDIGSRGFQPILRNLSGTAQPPLPELARQEHREIEPPIGMTLYARQWLGMAESQIFVSLQVPAALPAGIYSLDLGRDVAVRVLYTDLARIEQVAPDGIVVSPGSALFFNVPSGTSPVDLFAYRGFRIFDSANSEMAKTPLDAPEFGRFQFTPSSGPRYSIAPGPDQYFAAGVSGGETFVRFSNIPAIVASGDRARLLSVDSSHFPSLIPSGLPVPVSGSSVFAPGFAGNSIVLYRSVVEATAPTGFPFDEGTIEFWMQPLWSSTDFAIDRPSGSIAIQMAKRIEFFSLPPFHFTYWLNPDNNGGTPRYVISQLKLQLDGMEHGNDDHGAMLKYPTRLYFQQGRWYHIAVTWRINGVNSDIALFVNGREKSFEIFDEELGSVKPELRFAGGMTPLPGGPIRFGAGRPCTTTNYCDPPGELFDELRISRTRRYTADFVPPLGPFSPDAQTYLLMHFDNTLDMEVGGTRANVVSVP
jgi:hypothetical protein